MIKENSQFYCMVIKKYNKITSPKKYQLIGLVNIYNGIPSGNINTCYRIPIGCRGRLKADCMVKRNAYCPRNQRSVFCPDKPLTQPCDLTHPRSHVRRGIRQKCLGTVDMDVTMKIVSAR